ncbi:hypothetical protein pb186bvf_020623 [Paramecium bursaria]
MNYKIKQNLKLQLLKKLEEILQSLIKNIFDYFLNLINILKKVEGSDWQIMRVQKKGRQQDNVSIEDEQNLVASKEVANNQQVVCLMKEIINLKNMQITIKRNEKKRIVKNRQSGRISKKYAKRNRKLYIPEKNFRIRVQN